MLTQAPDKPLWRNFLNVHHIPDTLSDPITLPRSYNAKSEDPPQFTADPVQYLLTAYLTWLQPFEQHMTRHRANLQRNAATGNVAARPPPFVNPAVPPGQASSPVEDKISSPASTSMQTPSSHPDPSPRQPAEVQTAHAGSPTLQDTKPPSRPPKKSKSKDVPARAVPTPIKVGVQTPPVSWEQVLPDTLSVGSGKKRKRDKKGNESGEGGSDPSTPASLPGPVTALPPPVRPPTPTRARYRVEYRPLHSHLSSLAGWDERPVASTFPKNSLGQPTRSIHELGIVDMEAVLMGIRSRLPRELAYALTVLSMLSMPHPEENIGGLPLIHLPEIYLELLDLVNEAAFGEDGFDVWERGQEKTKSDAVYAGAELDRLSFVELEQLGRDVDFSLEEDEDAKSHRPRDRTGGQTDIVLTGLNILRNFSMLAENQPIMASRPELLRLLATVSNARLCRLPGDQMVNKPYSILELARVRRDVVCILTNVGSTISLRSVPFSCTLAILRLLSTFLTTGWEAIVAEETIYGPPITMRDGPPPLILSFNRALEAFCKLAASDANREVLARVPSDELVSLFNGLIRLFPSSRRSSEAMHTMEDYLGHTESLALSLYSLAFLAPQSTRAEMRSIPGAIGVLTRVIYDTIGRQYEFKSNPFAILCRRLCETLGVLNGTVSASGEVHRIGFGFSAGSGGGKGWNYASDVVERGWLASESQRLTECMGVRGLDLPAFTELDGMWWGGGE